MKTFIIATALAGIAFASDITIPDHYSADLVLAEVNAEVEVECYHNGGCGYYNNCGCHNHCGSCNDCCCSDSSSSTSEPECDDDVKECPVITFCLAADSLYDLWKKH